MIVLVFMCVSLSVCPLVCLRNYTSKFPLHVIRGRGLVLPWQRWELEIRCVLAVLRITSYRLARLVREVRPAHGSSSLTCRPTRRIGNER